MEIEVRGAPSHTRTLDVGVFHTDAAYVAARGQVLDLRKRGLVPMAGDLQTAGLIHHMSVEARVAREGPVLEAISAEQPSVAFEPSEGTGGECCRDPVRRIEALAGSPLDASFARRLGAAIGGPRGCSHVLTLAQLLGSTVHTALEDDSRRYGPRPSRRAGQRLFQRSLSIDGLEGADGSLDLALQLDDLHFTPVGSVADPLERLAARHEIRVHATIDLGTMTIRRIAAAGRHADASSLEDAPWHPRDLAFLEGHTALGGMARTLFAEIADTAEERPWLDALLNLAPAVIQCIPALTSHWKRWREASRQGGAGPSMMSGGGMVDSCYMWRREGFLNQRISEVMAALRK